MKQDLLKLKQQLQRRASGSQDQIVDLGSWHESLPGWLFQDPILDSVARNVYGIIKIQSNKNQATIFPDYETIGRLGNIGSKSTIAKSLQILRLTRWIARIEIIRDDLGRFNNNVYIIHDEPLPIEDVLILDDDYLNFVNKKLTSKNNQVRNIAIGTLREIETNINKGKSLSQDEKPHSLVMRNESHDYVRQIQNSKIDRKIKSATTNKKSLFFNRTISPSTETVLGTNLSENYPSTETVLGENVQKTIKNGAKPPSTVPSTVSVLCSSSFSLYKTTTTNNNKTALSKLGLQIPKMIKSLSNNEQTLMSYQLANIPEIRRQAALNEIAGRMLVNSPPVRNAVAYLSTICKRIKNGDLSLLTSHSINVINDEIKENKNKLDIKEKSDLYRLRDKAQNAFTHYKRWKKFVETNPNNEDMQKTLLDAESNYRQAKEAYRQEQHAKH